MGCLKADKFTMDHFYKALVSETGKNLVRDLWASGALILPLLVLSRRCYSGRLNFPLYEPPSKFL